MPSPLEPAYYVACSGAHDNSKCVAEATVTTPSIREARQILTRWGWEDTKRGYLCPRCSATYRGMLTRAANKKKGKPIAKP